MTRFTHFAQALTDTGWSIELVDIPSDIWWAKEIWELTSEWSPKGMKVYLSFLIDPSIAMDGNNPTDAAVWAVSLTNELPTSRTDVDSSAVLIKRRMKEAISKIIRDTSEMRTPK